MRAFISTGETSGEYHGVELAAAMRAIEPGVVFCGNGDRAMRDAGFEVWTSTRGWASMGPLQAIAKIPRLLTVMLLTAARIVRAKCDVVVLIDFGAFNVRLARQLRRIGYRGPIVYYIPPGAWLDRAEQAKLVAGATHALTIFAHQAEFYRGIGLAIAYFGHPLASLIARRPTRPIAAADGGVVALLPGSRSSELRRHLPILRDAAQLLVAARPRVRFRIGVANDEARVICSDFAAANSDLAIVLEDGARAALRDADAAWIASGTAVLEASLMGVPCVLMYVLSAAQARIGRRVYRGRFIGLPNLLLDDEVVPEMFQDAATSVALFETLENLLRDPAQQLDRLEPLRALLGPPDALERCARFVLDAR